MITIIGTNHTFNISNQVAFIVKYTWPDAVLVELDPKRLGFVNAEYKPEKSTHRKDQLEKVSWIYRSIAKRQDKVSRDNKSYTGNEMFTAIQTGKLIGAKIGLIDIDTQNLMRDIWREMSMCEKIRYFFSDVINTVIRKKKTDPTIELSKSEEKTTTEMRRKYPTIMKKLIDERNAYMTEQIKKYTKNFHNIVVVVGDTHVTGIAASLTDYNVRKIRFKDIADKNKFDNICAETWNNRGKGQWKLNY